MQKYDNNEVLINGLSKGKEDAYIFLLEKYHKKLFSYTLTLIHDRSLAQDIVQNTFIKTWRFRKKLKPEHSIQSFLYKMAYHEFVDEYRQGKKLLPLEDKYYKHMFEVLEETNEYKLERFLGLLSKEIEKLPPRCREIFTLSKQEGLTNKEISEHLSISIRTVEVQMRKAYNRLRDSLGEQYETVFFFLFGKKEFTA
ncbi:RNA polymerase sigma factor [Euzebyella saccharophila]|uniref:RNA polymerase sigma factor n=1 Tax=Euzebyella saccharophila TaxID=679664 RepID=A0ABV8JJW5_9FLAO|nr:sigma-70 family RNA polymerase sigma factor [Euzebyella saccharophila]